VEGVGSRAQITVPDGVGSVGNTSVGAYAEGEDDDQEYFGLKAIKVLLTISHWHRPWSMYIILRFYFIIETHLWLWEFSNIAAERWARLRRPYLPPGADEFAHYDGP
jgi:hypothetical protein